jgi:hypothetical protein
MKLKKKYGAKDEIPAGAESLYTEEDGAWVLSAEFEVPEGTKDPKSDSKLDEFRETNRKLMAENHEMKSKFGDVEKQLAQLAGMEEKLKRFDGVSPEQVEHLRKLAAKEEDMKIKHLLETGDLEAALEARFGHKHKEMQTEMDSLRSQVEQAEKRRLEKEHQLASIQAKTKFKSLISDRGLRLKKGAEDALDMFIDSDWTVSSDGDLELKRKDLLGDDGTTMRDSEYLERELLERKSFLFEAAKGGGADGNNDDGNRGPGNTKIIANDPKSVGMNLKEIADGKATINRPD